eukprot:gnl/TRDRNA2_/TRDRNA2_167234_c0_seq1.p1 gnl/TRDRNA2_/TRDRNA2_167234_c0~~gnl/TRDRNA2_/TRDRNA2_167234_c0_seq1.p1  ORF type:complete len:458 (+),score=53.93 gnl/TRDRNA2_/TRDRNA2_167234_c0_seq1:184-1557(+)
MRLIDQFHGQDLAIIAWACARLAVSDEPLLAALAAAAMQKISECTPQNLSNLAWALATISRSNDPLLNAISAASIRMISEFNAQNLANTAWSYARLAFYHDPLMTAISAAVLKRLDEFVAVDAPQESYAVLWALWRSGPSRDVGVALEESISKGLLSDALVHGVLLSDCEWRADAADERRLQLALGRGLPPSGLRTLWLHDNASHFLASPISFQSLYHMYRKLSKCVDYVSVALGSSQVLNRIEKFGHEIGQWLKVAGGEKAPLTEDALMHRLPLLHEVSAEFGAFIGYSGIRFARCTRDETSRSIPQYDLPYRWDSPVGVSFEVDPIHASVARHFIDLACLSLAAEVWLGQLQDTLPLLSERVGSSSLAFGFMDQRGTTFHEDLAQIERLQLPPERMMMTADNVNKPGAPLYLWHLTRTSSYTSGLWSLGEFASEAIEDWQSVSLGAPPRFLPNKK